MSVLEIHVAINKPQQIVIIDWFANGRSSRFERSVRTFIVLKAVVSSKDRACESHNRATVFY